MKPDTPTLIEIRKFAVEQSTKLCCSVGMRPKDVLVSAKNIEDYIVEGELPKTIQKD